MDILIVDDNADAANSFADYLTMRGHRCDTACDVDTALQRIKQRPYGLYILDVILPGMSGFSLSRLIRELSIDSPIILATAKRQLDDKLEGFRAGADDYLTKPIQLPELAARIEALKKRCSINDKKVLEVKDLSINLGTYEVTRAGRPLSLSPVCRRLLIALMKASPDVLTKEQMCELLWGGMINNDSLKAHMYMLRNAVDRPFPEPLIRTVRGVGVALR